ncbi:MAG: hypothetical protein RR794_03780 [Raoultibacter sp.]
MRILRVRFVPGVEVLAFDGDAIVLVALLVVAVLAVVFAASLVVAVLLVLLVALLPPPHAHLPPTRVLPSGSITWMPRQPTCTSSPSELATWMPSRQDI